MPTIIDSLIVQLGLDPKGFKAGSDEAQKQSKKTTDAVKKDAAASAAATDAAEKKRIAAIDKAAKQSATASKKAADSREKDAKRVGDAEKKSADTTVASFRRVATEFIGLFVAVRSVSDVVGFFERINASTRQLGLDSQNFGIAANELKNWQNVAELAGGTAEGATRTVASLQQALFNKRFKGEVSDQLIYLNRLGVQVESASGKLADFKSIVLQAHHAVRNNGRPREENFQFLQAAGFDIGTTNAILDTDAALKDLLDKVEKIKQATPEQTAAAQRMAQAWGFVKDKFEAFGREILVRVEPAITALFGVFNRFADYLSDHQNDITDWFTSAVTWITGPGGEQIKTFFTDLAAVVHTLSEAVGGLTGAWEKFIHLPAIGPLGGPVRAAVAIWNTVNGNTRGVRNNNPGNLKAVGGQQRDAEGFRIFNTREEGIDAANKQLDRYQLRGINTINKIVNTWAPASDNNNVPAYIAALKRATGKGANDPLTASDRAALLQGIFTQESGATSASKSQILAVTGAQGASPAFVASPETVGSSVSTPPNDPNFSASMQGYWQRVSESRQSIFAPNPGALAAARAAQPTPSVSPFVGPPTGAAGGPTTNLDIGSMTVVTQATDAHGMADAAYRALQRKMQIAQFDTGVTA